MGERKKAPGNQSQPEEPPPLSDEEPLSQPQELSEPDADTLS
jgi:hypothetical protein